MPLRDPEDRGPYRRGKEAPDDGGGAAPPPVPETPDTGSPYKRCPTGQKGDNGDYGPNCKPVAINPLTTPVSLTGASTFPPGLSFSSLVNPNQNLLASYQARSPYEQAALNSVSTLASALAGG